MPLLRNRRRVRRRRTVRRPGTMRRPRLLGLKGSPLTKGILTAGDAIAPFSGSLANPFPRKFRCKMYYADYAILNTASGTNFYEGILYGNGLYDPNYSGFTVNGQPAYRDTLAAIYNYYRVKSSRIKVHFQPNAATAPTTAMRLFIHATPSASGDTTTFYPDDPETLSLQPNQVNGFCGINSNPISLGMSMNQKRMYPNVSLSDSNNSATPSAAPTNVWYWHVSLYDQAHNTSSGAVTGYLSVTVEYDVEWFQLDSEPAN